MNKDDKLKVIFRNFLSPGDIMMLTAAVRDLKLSFPNFEIDVRTSCSEIWENNPYLTPLDEKAQEERRKRRLSSLSSEEIA